MLMELRVVSAHQSHLKDNASIKFEGDLLSIGRSTDNHWVLPDENLHLSGKHCIISRKNDNFIITDLSTNGVFIDTQELPLGRGRSTVLKHGTQVRIGDYIISVSIDQPSPKSSYAESYATNEPILQRESKGGLEAVLADKRPLEPSVAIPSVAAVDKRKTVSDHLSPEFSSFSMATPKYDNHSLRDVSSELPATNTPVDMLEQSELQSVLPEDWYLGLDQEEGDVISSIEDNQFLKKEIDETETDLSDLVEDSKSLANPEVSEEKLSVKTSALKESNHKADVCHSESNLLEKILTAADLDASLVKDETEIAEKIGLLLKNFSNGMIKALATRSLVKGEFRLHQTMIQPTDNNPFKFSPTGREALSIILFADSQAYQSGGEAVTDSYTDIQAHQLAMMSGVQESLFKLLGKVDPENLEEKFKRKPRHYKGVPGLKKIDYWEEYKDFYEELKASMSDDLQGFFIKEFGTAYEEQLAKITQEH